MPLRERVTEQNDAPASFKIIQFPAKPPGRKYTPGQTDLVTRFPEVAKLWDYEKNDGLEPSQFMPGSHTKVWWKCEKGHSWQAEIRSLTSMGSGCPCCAGRQVVPGVNDLATLHPEVLPLWDAEKNGDLDPTKIQPGAGRKVWWRCDQGHSWSAAPYSVAVYGSRCPECRKAGRPRKETDPPLPSPLKEGTVRRRLIPGVNDLATMYPLVAALWDEQRNGSLKPTEVLCASAKNVWWCCEHGHSWQAQIRHVILREQKCPHCEKSSQPEPLTPITVLP